MIRSSWAGAGRSVRIGVARSAPRSNSSFCTRRITAAVDLLRTFHLDGRYLRLFGNHDIQMRKPGYVSQHFDWRVNPVTRAWEPLLPGLQVHAALVLRHRDTGQELFVVHGHQGDLPNDQNWWMTMWRYRLFWKRLHALGFRSPSSPNSP